MNAIGRFAAFASPVSAALLAVMLASFGSSALAQSAGVFAYQERVDGKPTRLAIWLTQCDKFDEKVPKQVLSCTFTRPTSPGGAGDFGDPSGVLVFNDPRGKLCCSYDPSTGRKYCWTCAEPGKK